MGQYKVYDLGYLDQGIQFTFRLTGGEANVRLMDHNDYDAYQGRAAQHRFFALDGGGGRLRPGDYPFNIPHAGYWYLTVDLEGLAGSVNFGLERHNALPLARRGYDAFICYASEDRGFARPLADALERDHRRRVFFDQYEPVGADSLFRHLNRALLDSQTAVVLITRAFLHKVQHGNVPGFEVTSMVMLADEGQMRVLIVLDGVSGYEVNDALRYIWRWPTLDATGLEADVVADGIARWLDEG